MLNLIKYEFIRKYKLIAGTIITALALNVFLITRGIGGSATFLVLLPLVLSVLFIADIVKMYSDDLNNKTGYMLFMTPNSGYKIISSKVLTAVLEGFALLFIYLIFLLFNGAYIAVSMGNEIDFSQIIRVVNNLLSGSLGFNLGHISVFLLAALTFIIAFITTVYTAMTIRKSIFSEIITPYYDSIDIVSSTGRIAAGELAMILLPMIVVLIVQAIALTGISGYLLEKKINL